MSIAVSVFYHLLLMWTVFEVFMEFVTVLLLFLMFGGVWDLSSPTKDQTRVPQHWKAKS